MTIMAYHQQDKLFLEKSNEDLLNFDVIILQFNGFDFFEDYIKVNLFLKKINYEEVFIILKDIGIKKILLNNLIDYLIIKNKKILFDDIKDKIKNSMLKDVLNEKNLYSLIRIIYKGFHRTFKNIINKKSLNNHKLLKYNIDYLNKTIVFYKLKKSLIENE